MLGLTRLESEIRKTLKSTGYYDDAVAILKNEGEAILRQSLIDHGITGTAQDVIVGKTNEVIRNRSK